MQSVPVMSTYTIGFNHTSRTSAPSMAEAKRIIRREARVQKRFGAAPRLRYVSTDNGVYTYLSTEAMRADPDGSRAFAVISRA